jgi:hypothetical protein
MDAEGDSNGLLDKFYKAGLVGACRYSFGLLGKKKTLTGLWPVNKLLNGN